MKRLYVDPVSEVDQIAATIVKYIESCARAGQGMMRFSLT